MKFLIVATFMVVIVVFNVEAAVFRERAKIVDGKCQYQNELKADGEEWPEPGCIKRVCDVPGRMVHGIGCGKIGGDLPKGCRIVSGEGMNPECCEKIVCDKSTPNNFQTY